MEKWRFNKKFLKEKIKEGKLVLQKYDKNTDAYEDAKMMVEQFELLLGVENKSPKCMDVDFCIKLDNLNKVLNKSLNLIQRYEWEYLKNLCQTLPQVTFKDTNSKILPKKDKFVINASLDLFKKIDTKVYESVLSIVYNQTDLINLLDDGVYNDNCCLFCEYLKLPFVNVSATDDFKYVVLAHELRHAADYCLYQLCDVNLSELSAIYSEIIMDDEINRKYNCPNIYNGRINLFSKQIKKMVSYINILIRFDNCDRELTLDNYEKVLNVRSAQDLLNKYSSLTNEKHLILYDYIVSTLLAISFRDDYYNGNKDIINNKIEQLLLGSNYKLNYNRLEDRYVNYVNEVKTLSKK